MPSASASSLQPRSWSASRVERPALGYDARGWGLGTNTGDPRRDVERLARIVLDLVDDSGAPVSLLGWSLGGVLAREVARREPDAVRRVITYGTPVVGGARFTAVARAYSPGDSDAADVVARRLDAESPIRVPLTAVFTRRDGVVAWQACIDRFSPSVEHVEVSSTRIGMESTRTFGRSSLSVWPVVWSRRIHEVPRVESSSMFLFFSNRLGCFGSLVLSVVVTALLVFLLTR